MSTRDHTGESDKDRSLARLRRKREEEPETDERWIEVLEAALEGLR